MAGKACFLDIIDVIMMRTIQWLRWRILLGSKPLTCSALLHGGMVGLLADRVYL